MKIENRDLAMGIELNLLKGELVSEKVVLKIKLTIVDYWSDRNISSYIWTTV